MWHLRMRAVLLRMRGRLLRTSRLDDGSLPFDACVGYMFGTVGPEVTLEFKCGIGLLKRAYPALS